MASSTFTKTVYFKSNKDNQMKYQKVYANRTDNSFTFTNTFNLYGDGTREYLTLQTTWSAKARRAGDYIVSVLATTNHSEAYEDPSRGVNLKLKEETSNVSIVSGAPTINSLDVPNRSYSPGLNDSEGYVPPREDMKVRCQVTCSTGVQNVTLYYLVWPSKIWSSNAMINSLNGEWIGFVSGQPEGTLIHFYVEAFSSTESAIEEGRLCRFLDLEMLESNARIDIAVTSTIVLVGCLILFAVKIHKTSELL